MVENFKIRLKKYTWIFYWIFVFLVSAALLFLILPGEPKFKYEYQKGMPWRHDNLVAPFNFSILKTQAELDAEKADQLKTVAPYFLNDTTILEKQLLQLETDLNIAADSTNKDKQLAFQLIKNKISEIYQNGILQRSPESYDELAGKTEIKKRIGSNVAKIEISKLHSEKTAYNDIHQVFLEAGSINQSINNWLQPISPNKYIEANLTFDKITTDKEIEEVTSEILPSRGMVQLGERIILQGEIVDAIKFQLLESLKASYSMEHSEGLTKYIISVGKGLLILSLLALIFTFLYIYRADVLKQPRKLAFLMLFMCGTVFLANFINTFPSLHIYLVPLAIFPIIVRTFFDSRTAIFMLIITTILIGFYAPNNYEFILLEVSAGIVAVFSLNKMHRRVHLILATIWVLLTYVIVYTSLNLIHEGSTFTFSFDLYKWFFISSALLLSVYPLIYIFEKIFGFISDVTLIEISDSNQPLLRKLAEEAPGTFQHSMQIANLAEEVILKIGGNPFLVRAGALYHDIGKISKSHFFIENQAAGINPHDEISYIKSAEIIIDHVQNGVKMAQKHNLPEPIIEFIATHHGTTKANYFYIKHSQEHPDTKVEEDTFIYPGPLPRSKEAAVVMLVDGIEAATRSLPEKTYPKLKEVIDGMIDNKIKLRQLDHSALTFNDINTIKEILLQKLINIYHIRIEYPKEDKI